MAGFSIILFILIYGVILLASMVVGIIQIIATWKLYEKAGEPGWSSIVPVYYYMQQIKIATGSYKMLWIYLGLTGVYVVLCAVTSFMLENPDAPPIPVIVCLIVLVVVLLAMCAIALTISYYFAKAYGKSTVFCVLSIFFPQIMIIIMGFDKTTQYVGAQDVPQWLK